MHQPVAVTCADHQLYIAGWADQRQWLHCHGCQTLIERIVLPGEEHSLYPSTMFGARRIFDDAVCHLTTTDRHLPPRREAS